MTISKSILERFWKRTSKKSKDECWEFQTIADYGGLNINIEDRIWIAEKGMEIKESTSSFLASRFSYFFHKGIIPENLCVCHTCDHPRCVNPDHLFLGTKIENWEDMVRKGRAKLVKGGKTRGMTGLKHKESSKELVAASKRGKCRPGYGEIISKILKSKNLKHTEEWKKRQSEWMRKYHSKRKLGLSKTQ